MMASAGFDGRILFLVMMMNKEGCRN